MLHEMVSLWCVLVLTLAVATANEAQCSGGGASTPLFQSGYQKIPGFGEYKLHDSPMNWTLANRTCEDEGAHLVVMETEEERNAVTEMIRSAGLNFAFYLFWTGVYRDDTSSPWMTVLGRPLGSSPLWWPGNRTQTEDCVRYGTAVNLRGDGSVKCETEVVFLCEKQ